VKVAVVALAALAATGCMGRTVSGGGGSAGGSALVFWISVGGQGAGRLWWLCCPTGGTLPQPARACSRLDRLANPFAPVPKGVACTEVFGGPQVADVRGTFRGQLVKAQFTRTDGCQIARWNRVRFLLPSR
jgi:hypothetical protein